jgi:deoxyadenosine/deoxycytidine kinase
MICFIGNIGVGKSTLVRLVSDELGLTARLEEPDENPFIADFYAGKATAFASQLFFLNYLSERSLNPDDQGRPVLLERCIHDNCWVFSKLQLQEGRITPAEWSLFLGLYDKLRRVTPEPVRYLYCRCEPETAALRIRARGRSYEQDIPLAYLKAVDSLYEAWVDTLPPEQVVRIDTSHFENALAQATAAAADVLDPLGLAEGLLGHG